MSSRFTRIALLSMVLLLLLTPVASAAGPLALAQPGGQDLHIQPEAAGVIVDLALPDYKIEDVVRDGVTFQQIVIDADGWAQAGQPGAPELPERGVMLAIPPTGDISLQILDATPAAIAGRYSLQPAPDVTLEGEQLVERWQADPAEYAGTTWTPAVQAEIMQEGWLRGYRFVRLALRPFQVNPASGELRAATTLRVRVAFGEPGPSTRALPEDPYFAPVFWSAFANYDQARNWQTRPEPGAPEQRQAFTDPQVKVTVKADGLYRVTYTNLVNAGISAGTLGSLDPRTFRLLDQGVEQSIYVLGENDGVFNTTDYILFYGLRNKAALSDDNRVYWLTWGGANGQRMVAQNVAPASANFATTLLTTAHVEKNFEYKQQRPFVDWLEPVLYDQWYEGLVNNAKEITATLKADTASTVQPVASMWLAGDRDQPGTFKITLSLNGTPAQEKQWPQARVLTGTLALPAGALINGTNSLMLTPINVLGLTEGYGVWLDWLELTYPYNGDYLAGALFHNPTAGTFRYRITNSPASAPWLLNVGVPSQPRLLTGVTATATGGTYTLTWQQTTTPADRLVVIPDTEVRPPAAVQLYVDAGLRTPQQVDYLVIGHSSLLASVQPLVQMHSNEGLSVKVVDVRDIYDAFSDGSVSAEAIRDYLAYVYDNYLWPVPTYVLLVGDGTVNFRGYKPSENGNPNLIPPYLGGYDAWGGASVSDNSFTLLEGDDLLGEMIISRLPVNNLDEVQRVVDRTVNYAANFPAARAHSTLWITDNPDNDDPDYGTQFHMASDETIAELAPGFTATRVYFCNPTPPPLGPGNSCPDPWDYTDLLQARAAIVNRFNEGHVLAYYTGHGSTTVWAGEMLFYSQWFSQLHNGTALPFLLISSCTNGYFADPRRHGIDETLLRQWDWTHNNHLGSIGGYSGVTFDTLDSQTALLKDFVIAVMQEGITQTGVAATVARARTYGVLPYPDNERTAVGHGLSGDPALALVQPGTCTPGDLNCDNTIDIVDVQQVAAAWGTVAWSMGYNPRADLWRDGQIDVNDIVAAAGLWHSQ